MEKKSKKIKVSVQTEGKEEDVAQTSPVGREVPEENSEKPRIKTAIPTKTKRVVKTASRIFLYTIIVLIIAGVAFTYRITFSQNGGFFANKDGGPFSQVKHLVVSDERVMQGEENDRINILLIGYGGPGHSGGYLADTIILTSIQPSTNKVAMISLPRDLFVPIPKYGWRKINNAFAFGQNDDDPEGGEKLLVATVENILQQKIPYYVRVDFAGFENIIDAIGGVDINVACGFVDRQYPTADFGYQTISFGEGEQHMAGDTALQYARSRHGYVTTKGCQGEGSDFARSKRQQQILQAAKDKMLSAGTFLRPQRIVSVLREVGSSAGTNLELGEFARLSNMAKSVKSETIANVTIDSSNLLYSTTTVDGAYILRPQAGLDDFSELATLTAEVFNGVNDAATQEEKPTVAVLNGTAIEGLAGQKAQLLATEGYSIPTIANAPLRDYEKTVIYDLTNGQKPEHLAVIKTLLDANIATSIPRNITESDYTEEFVIVIGERN